MKVCLINPPQYIRNGYPKEISFPIGLAYIASYLKQHNVEVKIIDAPIEGYETIDTSEEFPRFGLSYPEILSQLISFAPDYIGITCMFTSHSPILHKLAKLIKTNIDIPIIAGGAHVSSVPITDKNIDFVVKGEGEQEILNIVLGINKPVLLSSLPMPAYELFNIELYATLPNSRSHIKKRSMSISTSRGCPYHCTFCSAHVVSGHKLRLRNPSDVIEEITYLKETYNIEHIFFEDDNITFNDQHATEIFIGITPLDITWETPNGIRVDTLYPTLISIMKRSGCIRLVIAIESGNQHFLNNVIHKSLNLETVLSVASEIYSQNIDMCAFFIVGIPGETRETLNDTFKFAFKLAKLYGVRPYFSFAIPLPSTEMWRIATSQGYLTPYITPFDYLRMKPLMNIKTITPEELVKKQKRAILKTLLILLIYHPKSLLQSETFIKLKEKFL